MTDIRIPTDWILAMADKINKSPDVEELKLVSAGGNVLLARRVRGRHDEEQRKRLGLPETYDVWDFTYNPGD